MTTRAKRRIASSGRCWSETHPGWEVSSGERATAPPRRWGRRLRYTPRSSARDGRMRSNLDRRPMMTSIRARSQRPRHHRISYVEAAELAWFGAKVLHPRTIAPAVDQKIPVRVLNTHNVSSHGTLVTEEGDDRDSGPRAVALKKGVTVVHMTSNKMLGAHGFLARLFAIFEQLEVSVDLITTSEVSVSVTIDDKNNLPQLVEKLKPVADVNVIDGQCIVAIVGRNLMKDSEVGARIFESMRGVPMSMFSLGTSGLNLSIVVNEKDADGPAEIDPSNACSKKALSPPRRGGAELG